MRIRGEDQRCDAETCVLRLRHSPKWHLTGHGLNADKRPLGTAEWTLERTISQDNACTAGSERAPLNPVSLIIGALAPAYAAVESVTSKA